MIKKINVRSSVAQNNGEAKEEIKDSSKEFLPLLTESDLNLPK